MRNIAKFLLSLSSFLVVTACTPTKAPDGGADPSPCPAACASLRASHCAEGTAPDGGRACEDVCRAMLGAGAFDVDWQCVRLAGNAAAVRACKGFRCSAAP